MFELLDFQLQWHLLCMPLDRERLEGMLDDLFVAACRHLSMQPNR
jgi:hypothetical protein